MFWDASDAEGRTALQVAAATPLQALPATFGEGFGAGWDEALAEEQSISRARLETSAWQDLVGDAVKASGQPIANPGRLLTGSNPIDLVGDAISEAVSGKPWALSARGRYEAVKAETRAQLAALNIPVPTDQDIHDRMQKIADDKAAALRSVQEGGGAGAWGALAGGFAGAMADPPNVASLALGAPAGVGVLRAMAIEAGVNMGVEATNQVAVTALKQDLGRDYGVGDAALAVGMAGGGAAALTAAGHGASATLRAFRKARSDVPLPDVSAADTSQSVFDAVYAQRVAQGAAPEDAATEAALWRARYRTRAAIRGGDAASLFARDNVVIEASNERGSLEQAAFHGSPHRFEQFSLDAVGAGEGQQAFGWGLYFAQREGVANWYRNRLSSYTDADIARAKNYLVEKGVSANPAEDFGFADAGDYVALAVEHGLAIEKPGRLFEVEIPDDGAYLLWDEPFSKQSKSVRDALKKINPEFAEFNSGEDIYLAIGDSLGDEFLPHNKWGKSASLLLRDKGVVGVKYRDGVSRNPEDVAYNYVLFDDRLVNVVRYEQAPAKGSEDGLARGSFTRETGRSDPINIIRIAPHADKSTFLHESGHAFLFQMIDDAFDQSVPSAARARLRRHLSEALKFINVKSDLGSAEAVHAAIGKEAHEKWARGFEAYLREGQAPSADLAEAFDRFKLWLVEIYRSIRELKVKLSPDVRAVYDRVLADIPSKFDRPNVSAAESLVARSAIAEETAPRPDFDGEEIHAAALDAAEAALNGGDPFRVPEYAAQVRRDIADLVAGVMADGAKGAELERVVYGRVLRDEIPALARNGLDAERLASAPRVIQADAISHAMGKHSRDPLPLRPEDVQRVPEVVREGELIEVAPTDSGKPGIVRRMEVDDSWLYVVEEVVGDKQYSLWFKTAYRAPKGKGRPEGRPSGARFSRSMPMPEADVRNVGDGPASENIARGAAEINRGAPDFRPLPAALRAPGDGRKPVSLLEFLKREGGLRDEGGELAAFDLGKRRPGLVSAKGRPLDYARERAAEAGYIPPEATLNDFVDAVRREAGGDAIYRAEDVGAVEAWRGYEAAVREAGDLLGGTDAARGLSDSDYAHALDVARGHRAWEAGPGKSSPISDTEAAALVDAARSEGRELAAVVDDYAEARAALLDYARRRAIDDDPIPFDLDAETPRTEAIAADEKGRWTQAQDALAADPEMTVPWPWEGGEPDARYTLREMFALTDEWDADAAEAMACAAMGAAA